MKRNIITSLLIATIFNLFATVPAGYYNTLNGKKGDALISAINSLSKGHKVITYGGTNGHTWESFALTDVRIFQGKEVWWDMYSNNIVYCPERAELNIEHAVANSWWGAREGSVEAYSDLFLLNPSDANANNMKSNNPMGIVANATKLDNGLSKVGTPISGQGGGSATVFEPADEYKGDFARAYFYVFTAYNDLSTWKSESAFMYNTDGTLQPWAVEMLLEWHRADPVDSKEYNRNEEIYKLQGNRNPYIDYPDLAEYVWGNKAGNAVQLSGITEAQPIDRPEAPTFGNVVITGVNVYSARWWDGFTQPIDYNEGELFVSLDGRAYYNPLHNSVEFDAAQTDDETHVIKAYTVANVDGYTLRSPIATLNLSARNPELVEYTTARWERVTAQDDIRLEDEKCILLSSNTFVAMSAVSNGSSSTSYMESAGLVTFDSNKEYVMEIPKETAVLEFENVGDGKYQLKVNDVNGKYIGSWKNTSQNKMQLSATTYSPGQWSLNDDDTFVFTFDEFGWLQFNKSQPRFRHYSTNQGSVYLYRYKDMEGGIHSAVTEIEDIISTVEIEGNDIIAPYGSMIYDLNGRLVNGKNLGHGIYIVIQNGKSMKIRL